MTDPAGSIYDPPEGAETPPVPTGKRACGEPGCPEMFDETRAGRMAWGRHRKAEHGIAAVGHAAAASDRLRQIVGGRAGGDKAGTAPDAGGAKTKETPPKPPKRHKRESLEKVGSGAFEALAWFAQRRGNLPMSRVFSLEAPAVGPAVEAAFKGTLVDRALQPFARLGGKGTNLARLAGLPAATTFFQSNPNNPMARALFAGALEETLPLIIESAEVAMRRAQKMEADLSRFADLFGKPPGSSVTLEDVASWIFAPPPGWEPPAPGEGQGPVDANSRPTAGVA